MQTEANSEWNEYTFYDHNGEGTDLIVKWKYPVDVGICELPLWFKLGSEYYWLDLTESEEYNDSFADEFGVWTNGKILPAAYKRVLSRTRSARAVWEWQDRQKLRADKVALMTRIFGSPCPKFGNIKGILHTL